MTDQENSLLSTSMKKLLLLTLVSVTGCSYSNRDDHSFHYHHTTTPHPPINQTIQQINNSPSPQPTHSTKPLTDEDYVSQYKQVDPPTSTPVVYEAPRLPKYKVIHNNRVEYHTPVVYTPAYYPQYRDQSNYMYRSAYYVSRPGY